MIKLNYLRAIILALCVCGVLACSQQRQACLTPKIATLSIGTIHYNSDTATVAVDTAIPAAVFSPLTGAANVYTIYPQQSSFTVSLSPDTTFCRWQFTTDSFLYQPDTISFYYRRHLQFLSNACGFTYFYDIDSVKTTHFIIDSVHILNTSVTNNVNTKHLQVYIHRNF